MFGKKLFLFAAGLLLLKFLEEFFKQMFGLLLAMILEMFLFEIVLAVETSQLEGVWLISFSLFGVSS